MALFVFSHNTIIVIISSVKIYLKKKDEISPLKGNENKASRGMAAAGTAKSMQKYGCSIVEKKFTQAKPGEVR